MSVPQLPPAMDLQGKTIDPVILSAELNTAGIPVVGLAQSADFLTMYDANGVPIAPTPTAETVVAAHVPAPKAIEFAERTTVDAVVRTTDATVKDVFRFPCKLQSLYRAELVISGIDAGNFTSLVQEGRFVWKRITANALPPGITVVSQIPTTIPAGWATNCVASGTDIVFSVQGPATRTIDWLLVGTVGRYAPGGLDGA